MASQRLAGIITVKVTGATVLAKGEFTYGYGAPKRTAIKGQDGVHGYTEEIQVAFIEGSITDRSDLDVNALITADDQTVTIDLANGKTLSLASSWYAGDGEGTTKEGELKVRWESTKRLQEIL